MIVLDASAMVEALIGCEVADELLDALTGDVHAPHLLDVCLLYTSPSPRDGLLSRMPSSA